MPACALPRWAQPISLLLSERDPNNSRFNYALPRLCLSSSVATKAVAGSLPLTLWGWHLRLGTEGWAQRPLWCRLPLRGKGQNNKCRPNWWVGRGARVGRGRERVQRWFLWMGAPPKAEWICTVCRSRQPGSSLHEEAVELKTSLARSWLSHSPLSVSHTQQELCLNLSDAHLGMCITKLHWES